MQTRSGARNDLAAGAYDAPPYLLVACEGNYTPSLFPPPPPHRWLWRLELGAFGCSILSASGPQSTVLLHHSVNIKHCRYFTSAFVLTISSTMSAVV